MGGIDICLYASLLQWITSPKIKPYQIADMKIKTIYKQIAKMEHTWIKAESFLKLVYCDFKFRACCSHQAYLKFRYFKLGTLHFALNFIFYVYTLRGRLPLCLYVGWECSKGTPGGKVGSRRNIYNSIFSTSLCTIFYGL